MSTVGNLNVKLGVDSKGMTSGFSKGKKDAKGFGTSIQGLTGKLNGFTSSMPVAGRFLGSMTSWLTKLTASAGPAGLALAAIGAGIAAATAAAVAAVGAYRTVVNMTSKVREEMDALYKSADRLGVSAEWLHGMQFAANMGSTGGAAVLDASLKSMTVKLREAAMGAGEAKDAVRALGFDARELVRLPIDKAFEEIAERLDLVENKFKQNQIAAKIFGEQGVALITMFGGMEQSSQWLASMGIKPVDTQDFNDSLTKLSKVKDGFMAELAEGMGPYIIEINESIMEWIRNMGGVEAVAEHIGSIIHDLVSPFRQLVDDAGGLENILRFVSLYARGLAVEIKIVAKLIEKLPTFLVVRGIAKVIGYLGQFESNTNAQVPVSQAQERGKNKSNPLYVEEVGNKLGFNGPLYSSPLEEANAFIGAMDMLHGNIQDLIEANQTLPSGTYSWNYADDKVRQGIVGAAQTSIGIDFQHRMANLAEPGTTSVIFDDELNKIVDELKAASIKAASGFADFAAKNDSIPLGELQKAARQSVAAFDKMANDILSFGYSITDVKKSLMSDVEQYQNQLKRFDLFLALYWQDSINPRESDEYRNKMRDDLVGKLGYKALTETPVDKMIESFGTLQEAIRANVYDEGADAVDLKLIRDSFGDSLAKNLRSWTNDFAKRMEGLDEAFKVHGLDADKYREINDAFIEEFRKAGVDNAKDFMDSMKQLREVYRKTALSSGTDAESVMDRQFKMESLQMAADDIVSNFANLGFDTKDPWRVGTDQYDRARSREDQRVVQIQNRIAAINEAIRGGGIGPMGQDDAEALREKFIYEAAKAGMADITTPEYQAVGAAQKGSLQAYSAVAGFDNQERAAQQERKRQTNLLKRIESKIPKIEAVGI